MDFINKINNYYNKYNELNLSLLICIKYLIIKNK